MSRFVDAHEESPVSTPATSPISPVAAEGENIGGEGTTGINEHIVQVFKRWDTDHSGKLTMAEVRAGFAELQLPATEEETARILAAFDTNQDGELTLEEFSHLVTLKESEIEQTFRQLDSNHNGYLERSEIEAALSALAIPYDKHSVEKLFTRYDTDHDQRISLPEFRAFLAQVPIASFAAAMGYWQRAVLLNLNADDLGYSLPVVPTSVHSASLINSLAGATSSILAKTSTAPLERLKVIFQMQTSKPPSMASVLSNIYRTEGVAGLFRGNFVNLLKSSPESAVKFAVFEWAKERLDDGSSDKLSSGRVFVAGALGGVAAHASCFPLEVLKTQLAASAKSEYKGIWDCVARRYQAGGVLAFYRGLPPVILSTIPHSGTSLATYQLSKDYFARLSPTGEPTTLGLMGAATISTICGQLVSQPLHVIKTRLIMHDAGGQHAQNGSSMTEILQNTWKREGVHGFFRGFVPSLLKGIPSHIISFVVYEYFRAYWGVTKSSKHH